MSDNQLTSSNQAAKRPDAYAFFRTYYDNLGKISQGETTREHQAFENRFGMNHGYSMGELDSVIMNVRTAARKARLKPAEKTSKSRLFDLRIAERWIRNIKFGVYLLAAIGLVVILANLKTFGAERTDVIPFAVNIIGIATLLLIITFALKLLESITKAPAPLTRFVAFSVSLLFLMLASLFVAWAAILVFRNAKIIPPSEILIQFRRPIWVLFVPGHSPGGYFPFHSRTTVTRKDGDSVRFELVPEKNDTQKLYGIFVLFDPGEDRIDATINIPIRKSLEVEFRRDATNFEAASLQVKEPTP